MFEEQQGDQHGWRGMSEGEVSSSRGQKGDGEAGHLGCISL